MKTHECGPDSGTFQETDAEATLSHHGRCLIWRAGHIISVRAFALRPFGISEEVAAVEPDTEIIVPDEGITF